MNAGDLTENMPRFQFQPFMNGRDDIAAMFINVFGFRFVLLLETPDRDRYPALRGARYRPRRIVVSTPTSTDWLTLSWNDHDAHEELTVRLVR